MMEYSGTYYYNVINTQIKRNVVTLHGILTLERHYDLYGRMPVVGVFFIIRVIVEQKGRFILKTDRFLYSIKYLYQFLLHLIQNLIII